jgi:hypothetical protein
VTTSQPWYRIHLLGKSPIYFGRKSLYRFDAPAGEFGVLYMGADEHCAFIEVFGQETGTRLVTAEALRTRGLARLTFSRPLRLMDLVHSGGLARIGADSRLFAGDHKIAQRWSRILREHPSKPDGLLYPSRHDPARLACALYDHCTDLASAELLDSLLDATNAPVLAQILNTYQFALIDA